MKNRSYILTAAACLMTGMGGLKAQATLTMESFHLMPGETRTVAVNMTNKVPIRALQVLVDLPDNVKLAARPTVVSGRKGKATDEFGAEVEAVKTLSYKVRDNGDCMIVVNASDAIPFSGSEGAVISLTLKADENSSDRSEEICLKDMELVYADGITYVRPDDCICKVDVCDDVTDIETLMRELEGPVDVYTLGGMKVKGDIQVSDLRKSLPQGVYIIDGVKVYVRE